MGNGNSHPTPCPIFSNGEEPREGYGRDFEPGGNVVAWDIIGLLEDR
jgi:hypothetical protein